MISYQLILTVKIKVCIGKRAAHKLSDALFCRPNDSRMLVALGESYEKLNSMQQAKKVSFCFL